MCIVQNEVMQHADNLADQDESACAELSLLDLDEVKAKIARLIDEDNCFCDFVLNSSDAQARLLGRYFGGVRIANVFISSNGIDIEKIKSEVEAEALYTFGLPINFDHSNFMLCLDQICDKAISEYKSEQEEDFV